MEAMYTGWVHEINSVQGMQSYEESWNEAAFIYLGIS